MAQQRGPSDYARLNPDTKRLSEQLRKLEYKFYRYTSQRFSGPRPKLYQADLSRIACHLDPATIPPRDAYSLTKCHASAVELAIGALRALRCFVNAATEHEDTDLLPNVLDLWPSVWEWAKYLLREQGPEATGPTAFVAVGSTLYAFCQQEKLRDAVLRTQGMGSELAQCWIQEGELSREDASDEFTVLLVALEEFVGSHPTVLVPLLTAEIGTKAVARMAVRRLRLALDESKPTLGDISIHLELLRLLLHSRETGNALRKALLSSGLTRQMIRCLGLLGNMRDEESALKLAMYCYTILWASFWSIEGGRGWIMQALELGLIPAYLGAARSWTMLAAINEPPYSCDLSQKTIGPWLVYRPVIRATAKHIRMSASMHGIPEPLNSMWIRFQDVVRQRIWAIHVEDENYTRECSSCGAENIILRVCTGCMGVRYCSRGCQRDHWTHHKDVCRHHRATYCLPDDPSIMHLTHRETSLLDLIARTEVQAQLQDASSQLRRDLANISVNDIVCGADLRTIPTRFYVVRGDARPGCDDVIADDANSIRVRAHAVLGDMDISCENTRDGPLGLRPTRRTMGLPTIYGEGD